MRNMIAMIFLFFFFYQAAFADVPPPPGSPNQSPAFPSSISAPFYGNSKLSGSRAPTGNWTTSEFGWKEDPGSPMHKKFTNAAYEFDDTNAYDFNIAGDRDKWLPVLAVENGKVISLGTTYNSGGNYNGVLIDHGSWASGYMHMKNPSAPIGSTVRKGQIIGYISDKGVPGVNHLHFAAYAKVRKDIKDSKGKISYRWDLVAQRVQLNPVPLKLNPNPSSSSNPPAFPLTVVNVGQTAQLNAWTPWGVNLSSAAANANTFWKSKDSKLVSIDGNGKIKGIGKGQTNVMVSYAGSDYLFSIQVK